MLSQPPAAAAISGDGAPIQNDDDVNDMLLPDERPPKRSRPASPRRGTSPSILGDTSILQNNAPSPLEPDHQAAFEDGIFPLLGIRENSFLPTPKSRPDDLLVGGMNNREAIILFETYRHSIHPFRAVVYDLKAVEQLMCSLLDPCTGRDGLDSRDSRDSHDSHDNARARHHIQLRALLHAILAYGAQFSDLPVDKRIHLTQKHGNNHSLPPFLHLLCWSKTSTYKRRSDIHARPPTKRPLYV